MKIKVLYREQKIVKFFQLVLGKEIQARLKNLRMCFKRELDSQKNATSGESSRERRKYLYFDQLLFLLPHIAKCKVF